ncbi:MAG: GNAT family N-acetyltransferase [Pseudonocardiaceae bacterium]
MTATDLLSLDQAAACGQWARMCGPADLFCTPQWLAVEREAVGPWVPRVNGCLIRADEETILAGLTVQQFDLDVDDETVRLDKMFPPESAVLAYPAHEVAEAVQPSVMCGTWFNSTVLTAPGLLAERATRARRDLLAAAVDLSCEWQGVAMFFPFVDAADTGLRDALRDAGFIEFAAPARHVFDCDYTDYAEFVDSLRSRRRTRLRKEIADIERSGLRTELITINESTVDRVAWLAHQLEDKHGQRSTYDQIGAWFSAIARHTETIVFTAARTDGPPVAMSMWIHYQDRLYGFHAGFDYEHCQGLPMYSLVGYHLPMRFGCARPDISVLEYGVSSDQAKLLRGTKALPQVLCVKPLSPKARRILCSGVGESTVPALS